MERPRQSEKLQVWTDLLARLDGRPVWVLKLLEYVCAVLQRRDRINIYDAARHLSPVTHDHGHIGAADIRKELQELCGLSQIEWTGRFGHRAFLSDHAHVFWREIVLPAARRPEPWDLGMAVTFLLQRDIRSIWGDRVLGPYLPTRARSATKLACVCHIVKKIYRSPEEYDRFRKGQLATESRLTESRLREWSELLADGPWVDLRLVGMKGTGALVQLMDLALVRPLIVADSGELRVRLASTVRFETAKTAEPVEVAPLTLGACVEQAAVATAEAFGKLNQQNSHQRNRQREHQRRRVGLVERQFALLGERDAADVLEFVTWLREAVPGGAMAERVLPGDYRCELWQGSKPGRYAPYVFPHCSELYLVETAKRYGLVSAREADGIISLTELAGVAERRHRRSALAKLTWGRNVDRLTVTPVDGLPDTALDMLRSVAQELASGEFLVTPNDIAARNLDEDKLRLALGSFARLSPKNVQRLRRWVSARSNVSVLVGSKVAVAKQRRASRGIRS